MMRRAALDALAPPVPEAPGSLWPMIERLLATVEKPAR